MRRASLITTRTPRLASLVATVVAATVLTGSPAEAASWKSCRDTVDSVYSLRSYKMHCALADNLAWVWDRKANLNRGRAGLPRAVRWRGPSYRCSYQFTAYVDFSVKCRSGGAVVKFQSAFGDY